MTGRATPDRIRVRIRLTPRSAADRIDGVVDGELRARTAVAPVDGAANAALSRLLARELGLPRMAVVVVSGVTSRRKLVEIRGAGVRTLVETRWPDLTP